MREKKNIDFHPEGFTDDLVEAIHQLGELKDLELERCISNLIKRTDSILFAKTILQYLEMINKESQKIVEKDRLKNSNKINLLHESLKQKSLTPMERRFVYEEMADLIKDMESTRRYWLQKSLTSFKYVGAAGAVFAAAFLFRKKK
jgi:recombinational DNA repair ATPase RecF